MALFTTAPRNGSVIADEMEETLKRLADEAASRREVVNNQLNELEAESLLLSDVLHTVGRE